MTLLMGGIALIVAAAIATVTVHVSVAAAHRARAQTAADAAALAAVAESAPGEAGDPRSAALRFARSNGARLVACLCEPGATAAQVTVEVGRAVAKARAVFDAERVLPASAGGMLQPPLQAAVDRLLSLAEGRISVTSGIRSHAEQSALWAAAVERHGSPEAADDWVARPGSSKHELGLAVDLSGDLDLALRLIERFDLPLIRPLPHEPWHFELALT